MQWPFQRTGEEAYLSITLAAVQAILIGGILWQVSRGPNRLWESGSAGSEVPLPVARNEADAIATAHIPGSVVDTDVIRDNGVVSYLITIDPDDDSRDDDARWLLFVDPAQKRIWRDERWSTNAHQTVSMTKPQAETAALKQSGAGSRIKSADLQHYEGRDVWQVKVVRTDAPALLMTIDAENGEVLRAFEVLRDY